MATGPPTASAGDESPASHSCEPDEEELLSKLLQQNKLLEEDVRFTTRITSTSSSSLPGTNLSTSDPTLRSHDQAGWLNKLRKFSSKTTSSSSLRSSSSEVVENGSARTSSPPASRGSSSATKESQDPPGTVDKGYPVKDTLDRKIEALPGQTFPLSSASPTLCAETPSGTCVNPGASPSQEDVGSDDEEEEEEEEGEELGLEVERLDPMVGKGAGDCDTIKSYHLVLQDGDDSSHQLTPPEGAGSEVQSKAETDQRTSPAGSTSQLTKVGVVNGEEDDILSDLPSSSVGKGRRPRSETESKGVRMSLISFKPRKRSQTVHEGEGSKNREDQEEKPASVEETQWQQWSDLLKNWEESGGKNSKAVRHLTRQGVPEHLRGMAWQLLSNSLNTDLREKYPILITESSPHERAIKRDLNRTFPEHAFFKERDGLGQESLLNVLKAYSVYDKEVGYCQGSPFIVGLLLMQMPEEEAFCVLVNLMTIYQLRDFYKPSMTDLSLCFYQLEKLIEEMFPPLSKHFKAVGFQTSIYASPWFLTMFASVLSLNVAFRVVDLVMVEGKEFLFRVGLALLDSSQDTLVKMDMEEMMKYFQKGMRSLHESDPEQLIQKALKIKLHSKKIKKYAKEYLDKKARKALEITEMTRLQNENMDVTLKLAQAQQECESLAQQLISGRIERAQEAEEVLQLRRELALARKKLEEIGRQGTAMGPEKYVPEREGLMVVSPDSSGTRGSQHEEKSDNEEEEEDEKEVEVSKKRSYSSPPFPKEVGVAEDVGGSGLGDMTHSSHSTLYKEGSSSPQSSPFIRRGHSTDSKQNLFLEGDTMEFGAASPQAPPTATPTQADNAVAKKKKKKRLLGRSKSGRKMYKMEPGSPNTSPPAQPAMEDKEGKKKKKKKDKKKERDPVMEHMEEEDLERELVLAKTQIAEYAGQLEEKLWEAKQAHQREKVLNQEVEQLTTHLTLLQAKLSKVNSSDLCSQCWSKIALGGESDSPASSCPSGSTEDTGPHSSQALLTNLRAIWKSSPQPGKKEIT